MTLATGARTREGVYGLVVAVTVLGAVVAAGAQSSAAPQVGDLAPDFELTGTDGRVHTLREHRGLRPVVIAWFPKAFAKI